MKRRLLAFFLLTLPLSVMAADGAVGTILNPFKVSAADKSLSYLRQIFGNVGGALHGVSGQAIGEIFTIYNSALLSVAGLYLMYVMIRLLSKGSKNPNPMMPQSGTAYAAGRVAAGTVLLIPNFSSGYSMVQVVVMWVAVQGVGMADTAWQAALNYIDSGGTISTISAPSKGTQLTDLTGSDGLLNTAGNILKSELCMLALERDANKKIEKAKQADKINKSKEKPRKLSEKTKALLARAATIDYRAAYDDVEKVACFGQDNSYFHLPGKVNLGVSPKKDPRQRNCYTVEQRICGVYRWSVKPTSDLKAGTSLFEDYLAFKKAGLVQIINDLMPYARAMTSKYFKPTIKPGQLLLGENPYYRNTPEVNALITAATTYLAIVRPIRKKVHDLSSQDATERAALRYKKALADGWIMAGSYYYELAQQRDFTLDEDNYQIVSEISPDLPKMVNQMQAAAMDVMTTMMDSDQDSRLTSAGAVIATHAEVMEKRRQQLKTYKEKLHADSLIKDDIGSQVTDRMNGMINAVWDQWVAVMAPTENDIPDPVARLRLLGMMMLQAPIHFWSKVSEEIFDTLLRYMAIMSAPILALSVVGGFFQMAGPTAVGIAAISMSFDMMIAKAFWYLPFATSVAMPIFFMGLMIGVYVPLIPFLVFTFAALGWMIAVVEAMVAGPLIALGLTHPEGHDMLGKAEQGMMLLLSLFIRPIAMIIGFFGAIILTFISLRLVNYGFYNMVGDFFTNFDQFGGLTAGVAVVSMMVVYTFTIMYLVEECFNLIYLVPDQLMRWIGGPTDTTNVPRLMDRVKSQSSQGAQEGARGAGQVASTASKARIKPASAKQGKIREQGKPGAGVSSRAEEKI
jgi:defect-in-organelle-trafficking protein DotA